jgi:hypothetical protein
LAIFKLRHETLNYDFTRKILAAASFQQMTTKCKPAERQATGWRPCLGPTRRMSRQVHSSRRENIGAVDGIIACAAVFSFQGRSFGERR